MKKHSQRPVPTAIHSAFTRFARLFPFVTAWRERGRAFMACRPHRSFQLTRRRDYARSLRLPGYWQFTGMVWRMLWVNRRLFGWLLAIYIVLSAALVGITSQDTYGSASSLIREASQSVWSDGSLRAVSESGLVLVAVLSGSLTDTSDTTRPLYAVLLGLLMWLTVVWLVRALLAGQRPRLRDGLYGSGAPLLATFLLLLVFVAQLLPVTLASFGYTAATASGLLDGGVEAMLFWTAVALLIALSLYWTTSTFIALVIVTLPGMYPYQALKAAGDVVIGRRVRVLLRIVWILLLVVVTWFVVMVPVIMFDSWLKSAVPAIDWLPLVPILLLILSSTTVMLLATYIYMLYRKIVDDDAAPAAN